MDQEHRESGRLIFEEVIVARKSRDKTTLKANSSFTAEASKIPSHSDGKLKVSVEIVYGRVSFELYRMIPWMKGRTSRSQGIKSPLLLLLLQLLLLLLPQQPLKRITLLQYHGSTVEAKRLALTCPSPKHRTVGNSSMLRLYSDCMASGVQSLDLVCFVFL